MAKNPRIRRTYQTGEEEIGFVTRSEDFLTENNGALSKAEARFAVFDSVTRKVESSIKSATDSIEYLGKAIKKVDETSRELSQEFFVKSTSKAETQKALDYTKGRYIGSGDLSSLADSSSLAREENTYKTLETVRRITGAENKKALADIAKEKGFSVSYSKQKGFEDFATIKYRAEKTLLDSYAQEHEDYLKAKQNGLPWTGSKEARLTAESRIEKETFGSLFKQSDKLYKEQQEQAQKEKQAKEAESSRKRSLGAVLKIWAGITILADIARRILTAILDKASKERSDFIGGASLGVSAVDVRNYRNIEKAKGLPEGSFMGFLSDLQTNFGDERNINEDALTEIAPYIPEAVAPLVRAGKMNLQELSKIILDKAQSLIEEGKNWRGEEVGVTESRRSILTSLGRFSLHAKAIAENMVDTDLYGVFAGQAKGVDAYLEAGLGAKTKFTETELAQYKEVVQLVDGIKGQFKTIKDDIMTDIVRSFSGIANFLYNLDIGKRDEEKLKDQIERRDRVFQSMTEMSNIKSTMSNLIGARLEGLDLASIGGKDFDSVDSMLDYMTKHPDVFMAKLKGFSAYAPLRNILSSDEMLAMLGVYKIAKESYKELETQSKKPIDKIKYNYTDYTQAGMSLRVAEDPFIQEFKSQSTPWEAHQYALSSDKGYSSLVSEPDLFDSFGEILTYIQEASTKAMTEDRDLNMRQVLDKFATYLSGTTGHYVGTGSEAGVAPRSSAEAVRNINSYLKGIGYTLTESDFDKFNSIIMDMGDEDAFRRVTGIEWSEKNKIAPYQRALDYKKERQFGQSVSALISASAEGALLNAMEDAVRKAEGKGLDSSKSTKSIHLSSVDEGKLKIDVSINNEASREGITVSASSRLTTPTLKDKIDTAIQVNNR